MRQEIVEFGIEMGVKPERMDEILLRGRTLGTQAGSNPAWIKAVADEPDLSALEKTFLAVVITGVLMGAAMQKGGVPMDTPVEKGDCDPMFR